MTCVCPPSMYWPRKEMKARKNVRKRVQRTQLQPLRRIQNKNKKHPKQQQMYKMTDTKIFGKKNYREHFHKKFSPKMEKEKKTKLV